MIASMTINRFLYTGSADNVQDSIRLEMKRWRIFPVNDSCTDRSLFVVQTQESSFIIIRIDRTRAGFLAQIVTTYREPRKAFLWFLFLYAQRALPCVSYKTRPRVLARDSGQLCWHHSFPNPCASSRSVYQREIDPRHWYGFVTHRL